MTLSSSIASRHASSAAARWGAEIAMTTLVCPMSTRPIRWWIATSHSSCLLLQRLGQLDHDLLGHALVGLVLEVEHVAPARASPRRADEGRDRARLGPLHLRDRRPPPTAAPPRAERTLVTLCH